MVYCECHNTDKIVIPGFTDPAAAVYVCSAGAWEDDSWEAGSGLQLLDENS